METKDSKSINGIYKEATAVVNESAVKSKALSGNGFTYRHDWSKKHGSYKLNLTWNAINRNSRVFVSASEFDENGCDFIGSAKYHVNNVAPYDGGVNVWIDIDWRSDIRVHLDYLIVIP